MGWYTTRQWVTDISVVLVVRIVVLVGIDVFPLVRDVVHIFGVDIGQSLEKEEYIFTKKFKDTKLSPGYSKIDLVYLFDCYSVVIRSARDYQVFGGTFQRQRYRRTRRNDTVYHQYNNKSIHVLVRRYYFKEIPTIIVDLKCLSWTLASRPR